MSTYQTVQNPFHVQDENGDIVGYQKDPGNKIVFTPRYATDPLTGKVAGLTLPDGTLQTIAPVSRQTNLPMLILGDSISAPAVGRPPLYEGEGRMWCFNLPTGPGTIGTWISQTWIDNTSTTVLTGDLETDGLGRLRFKSTGDASYGPYYNVCTMSGGTGGFYYLLSGNGTAGIVVSVRGTATPPAAASAPVTQFGGMNTWDFEPKTYVSWMAGALGERFSAYKQFAIPGATTSDMVLVVPQALANGPYGAAVVLLGINDAPTTAAAAQATIANMKSIIDQLCAAVPRVYVGRPLANLNTAYTATMTKYTEVVSSAVRDYCATKTNAVYWSAHNQLLNNQAYALAFASNTDYQQDVLHPRPGGAAKIGYDILAPIILRDFPVVNQQQETRYGSWDATLKKGVVNTNPTLRVSAGGTLSGGVTGIAAPDTWTISRSGATQACLTSWVAATDGGNDWYTLTMTAGNGVDYNYFLQNTAIPSGISQGDLYQLECEIQVGAITGSGLFRFDIFCTQIGGTVQIIHPMKNIESVNPGDLDMTGFTGRKALTIRSAPMKLANPSISNFGLRAQFGLRGQLAIPFISTVGGVTAIAAADVIGNLGAAPTKTATVNAVTVFQNGGVWGTNMIGFLYVTPLTGGMWTNTEAIYVGATQKAAATADVVANSAEIGMRNFGIRVVSAA